MTTKPITERTNGRATELIANAVRFNAKLDKIDRKFGFASPREVSPVRELNTAIEALLAGLAIGDWDTVAQGTVLAAEVLARLEDEDNA